MITPRSHYYNGKIAIPNAKDTAPNSNLLGNSSELDLFREQFERDVLTKCFGYTLYKEFQSNLEIVSPATEQTLKSGAASKWSDLLYGKEYQIDGKTYYWKGLINNEESLISFYVFHHYLKKNLESYTGIGLVKEEGKNSTHVSPRRLYVDSYNWFYTWSIGNYYDSNTSEYGIKSLYQFICDMNDLDPTTYSNWMPHNFSKLNIMGI